MHRGEPRLLFHVRPSWPDVRVASVWLPQLPLRVIVLRHPAWDGRPVVLSAVSGERKVVQLCSLEAEWDGILLTIYQDPSPTPGSNRGTAVTRVRAELEGRRAG